MKYKYILPLIFTAVITFIGASASYAQVSSITIGNGTGTPRLSLGDGCTLTVSYITINGKLESTSTISPATIYVRTGWENNGTFIQGLSNVQFIKSLLGRGTKATIKGDSTFYNLIAQPMGSGIEGRQLEFEAGTTQIVENGLTLRGRDMDDRLELRSSNAGSQASIDLSSGAIQDIAFVDVQDHVAVVPGQYLAPGSASLYWSVDGGNNDRWFLAANTDDPDSDNLTDSEEILIYDTDPNSNDSDGDGVDDGIEVANYSDPNNSDTDYDGLDDGFEAIAERNTYDSDGDGVSDFFETLGFTIIMTVNKFNDTADGTCDSADCSLREAVIAANATRSPVIIILPPGTYNLTKNTQEDLTEEERGDLDITGDLAIVAEVANGDGAYNTIIQGSWASFPDRIFHVDGYSGDRPIYAEFNGITIKNGVADESGGGGIWCENGEIKIRGCIISDNTGGGNPGVGIMNEDTALILRSTVSDNTWGEAGGGIYSNGDLTIVRSKVSNNSVTDSGGGIIQSSGDCYLVNCTISGNYSDDLGGGISLESGTMTITGSTIGGDESVTTGSANSADSSGGGIAISGRVTLDITNTTISNNTAVFNGGGIYNVSGIVNITSSTIFKNNSGGSGGGIYDSNSTITLRNTILAGNTSDIGGGSVSNVSGTLDSQGYNMFGDTTGAIISTGPAADISYDDTVATGNPGLTDVLDPFLDPGPAGRSLFPIIDNVGNPAKDACEAPPTIDQLNFFRLDGFNDIGANELIAIVNDLIVDDFIQNPDYSTIDPPSGFAGVFSIELVLTNGPEDIQNPFFEVFIMEFSNGSLRNSIKLLNADGGLSGVGATLTPTSVQLGGDNILNADDTLTVSFEIALPLKDGFRFWVNLKGTP